MNRRYLYTFNKAVFGVQFIDIRIDSTDYKTSSMEYDEYGRAIMYVPIPLPDGDYDAKIVIETISPISFLLK